MWAEAGRLSRRVQALEGELRDAREALTRERHAGAGGLEVAEERRRDDAGMDGEGGDALGAAREAARKEQIR